MAQKIFASPCAVQSSWLFSLSDDILINEVIGRVDLLTIQCFRATCQEARSKVEKAGNSQVFWKQLFARYYSNRPQDINDAINPKKSFIRELTSHKKFVQMLAESTESNLSGICKESSHFINSKNWANNDNTPLMELIPRESNARNYYADQDDISVRELPSRFPEEMLKHGVDINLANAFGSTPLHLAAQVKLVTLNEGISSLPIIGSRLVFRTVGDQMAEHNVWVWGWFLLDNGANINAQDKDGSTPLHDATRMYNIPIVTLLLERGAKADIMDNKGQTPLDLAKGCHEIEKLFHLTEKSETNNVEGQNTIERKTKKFFSKLTKF